MKIIDIIKRANKNLTIAPLRSILTILALVVGALTLTLTTALGEGGKDFIQIQADSLVAPDTLIVQDYGNAMGNPLEAKKYNPKVDQATSLVFYDQTDVEKIMKLPDIVEIETMGLININYITTKNADKYSINVMNGINSMSPRVLAGEYSKDKIEKGDNIILAFSYLKALNLGEPKDAIGKKVQLYYSNSTGEEKSSEFTISSVLTNSYINAGSSYISKEKAQEISDYQTVNTPLYRKYPALIIKTTDNLAADRVSELKTELKDLGYSAQTVEDQIAVLKGIIQAIQMSLGFFAAISIVASLFGIVNTLLMGVYERTSEIGLLRALGMNKNTIFKIFAFEAISVGFWGALVGSVFAFGLGTLGNYVFESMNIQGFEGLKLFLFHPSFSLIILGSLMFITFLAGIFPAMKASRLDPIKALRYE